MEIQYSFGIEIEFYMPNEYVSDVGRAKYARKLRELGFIVYSTLEQYEEQYDNTQPAWRIKEDGSLNTFRAQGAELISPPLVGEDGKKEALRIIKAINKIGTMVDNSCSVHLHIHPGNDINLEFCKNLIRFYKKYEKVIDSFMPSSRRENNGRYCRSMKKFTEQLLSTVHTMDQLNSALHGDRYTKINFLSYWKYGTIEFRHHGGSTNPAKIITWLDVCLNMVHKARDKMDQETNPIISAVPAETVTPSVSIPHNYFRYGVNNYRAYDIMCNDITRGWTNQSLGEAIGCGYINIRSLLESAGCPYYTRSTQDGTRRKLYFIGVRANINDRIERARRNNYHVMEEEFGTGTFDDFIKDLDLSYMQESYLIDRVEQLRFQ